MLAIRLLLRTLVDVVLIVAIAAAVSGSILYFDHRKYMLDDDPRLSVLKGIHALGIPVAEVDKAERTRLHYAMIVCREMPPDDAALEAWARSQPGAERIGVQREDGKTVILHYREPDDPSAVQKVPWEDLGYKSNGKIFERRFGLLEFAHDDREYLLLHLGCLQIGIAVVALGRWGWNRWRRVPMAPLAAGPLGRALLFGVGAGVVMAAFVWLYDAGLRTWVGPTPMTTRAWAGAGIDLLPWAKDLVWLAVLFVGPLIQELYFRGVLFGSWWAAKLTVAGLVVSAILAALARLDWYHFPFALLLAAALAETYRRARHLLAPLIAHSLTNLILLGLLLGSLRGWPDASSQIVGVWINPADTEKLTVEFTRDGHVLTEQPPGLLFIPEAELSHREGGRRFTTQRYEFLDRERFRVRERIFGIPIVIVQRVAFEGDEMIVTIEESGLGGAGNVIRYRRVQVRP